MSARSAPPSMSEQNLLATIRQIFPDLEVDMRDIKNPTQTFIGNFYALFLEDFGADVNELSQVNNLFTTVHNFRPLNQLLFPDSNETNDHYISCRYVQPNYTSYKYVRSGEFLLQEHRHK